MLGESCTKRGYLSDHPGVLVTKDIVSAIYDTANHSFLDEIRLWLLPESPKAICATLRTASASGKMPANPA